MDPRTRLRVLITVKAYPVPSVKYEELVCTAGVLEDRSFVRLYPIDYRFRPYDQWYRKYQWIEVDAVKNPNDPRPESYRPVGEITCLGNPLPTTHHWAERKRFVLAKGTQTMCHLSKHTKQTSVSLGIIQPREIMGFDIIQDTSDSWSREEFYQLRLFTPPHRPLEKIPYKFYYHFKCQDPECKGHRMMIEDWEVGQLYRSERDRFNDRDKACAQVRKKFLDQICAQKNDTHFFVGTVLQYGTWVILGTFYPKKIP